MHVVGFFSLWKQELRVMLSPQWWMRLLFFAWRRLSKVWRNPYFLLSVIWLQIICIWGGFPFVHLGCYCFEPTLSPVMRGALGLVQAWYFYLLVLLLRVSLYPPATVYIRLLEKERGLLWVFQLLVPIVFGVFLLDQPFFWPVFLLWAFIAADSRYLGMSFAWKLPLCVASWVFRHAPFLLVSTGVFYWISYYLGNALMLYFVILPSFAALLSAVYTLWLDQQ